MVQTVVVPLFHAWKWGEAILAQSVPESNTYPEKKNQHRVKAGKLRHQ